MELFLADEPALKSWLSKESMLNREVTAELVAMGFKESTDLRVSGTTAVIPVNGPLTYRYDAWSYYFGGRSYGGIMRQVQAAEQNTDIDRIVFVFDTPGGTVTGCSECADVIRDATKPTVALVMPQAASAGLWLASQADEIVSTKSGGIGSLGVMSILVSYSEALKDEKVDVRVIRSAISPNKNMGLPYEDLSEEVIAHFQSQADKYGEQFLSAVAKGRGVTREKALDSFGQGHMLDAEDALKAGLVDRIDTLEGVLSSGSKPSRKSRRRTRTR